MKKNRQLQYDFVETKLRIQLSNAVFTQGSNVGPLVIAWIFNLQSLSRFLR